MTSELLRATVELLAETSREQWHGIAKACGVSYQWLARLDEGKIPEPGVNKIEKLYSHLSGKAVKL